MNRPSEPVGGERVRIERLLPASIEDVFAALTDPGSMAHWLSPTGRAEVEADVRVGGQLRVVMIGDDTRIEHTGEYLEVDAPRQLSFTWRSPHTGEYPSIVTVTLSPNGDTTRLLLIHDRLPPETAAAHKDGWGAILERLAAALRLPLHGREAGQPRKEAKSMHVQKTARFTVAAGRLPEALAAIRAFVEYTRTEPGTLVYESWQSAQRPGEFLHLMEFVDADAEQAHATSESVKSFTDSLYPLCAQSPSLEEWSSVS